MPALRKLPLLIALTGLSISTVSYAEYSILDELVVTGTRSETSIMDLAGNTAKVSEQDIDLVNANHIEELLLRVPGVNLQRGSGAEMTIAIRSPVLTGPGASGSFLFMEDDIALRSAAFGNNNGLSEANFEQAGSVEVIRGPGSALYGSNAVHGLVNVLSRAPSKELDSSIDLTLGENDLYKVKATLSNTNGAHAYRFNFSGVSDGGWRDDTQMDQQKFNVRHDYFAANGDSFKTIFSAFNLNQDTAGYITSETDDKLYEDDDVVTNNENKDAYRNWSSVRLSSRWDHETAGGNLLSITPYFRSNEMEFRQHYLPSKAIEENGHDSLGAKAAYYMDLAGGHNIIFGTDVEFTQGYLKETQEKDSTFSFGKARQQGVHYDYDVDAFLIAPFVHAEWQLASKLRATTGLRYEHTEYKYENNVADGTTKADGSSCYVNDAAEIGPVDCLYQRPEDSDDNFNDWSPKLGLVYRLAESHSVYSNLSRAYRAPQTTDMYRIQKDQTFGDMESEQVDSFEVGFRGDFQQFLLNYEVSAYYMEKENYFFRDSFGNSVTDGKTKHQGIEIAAGLPLGNQFDVSGNYTYAIHQYDFDHAAKGSLPSEEINKGDDIDTAPRTLANLRLGWNFHSSSRAELEWSYISEYYMDPSNSAKYDGHDLLNLRIDTQVSKHLGLHAQIKNLLDEEYADRADYAFGDYRFNPGQERHYEVGARYSF